MKRISVILIFFVLTVLPWNLAIHKNYLITPLQGHIAIVHAQYPNNVSTVKNGVGNGIIKVAQTLYSLFGHRPYWEGPSYQEKQNVAPSDQPAVISHVMACESGGDINPQDTDHIDSNGLMSYGCLQYQMATWNNFSQLSGISGSPDNCITAIQMTEWALSNGYLNQWSCSRLLGIIKN